MSSEPVDSCDRGTARAARGCERDERVRHPVPAISTARRVQCVRWWDAHGRHVPATCRTFAITPRTLARWVRRYRAALRYRRARAERGGLPPAHEVVRAVEQLLARARAVAPDADA